MERFYAFMILACILLLGLSGCMTSGKVSMRERMLNAAWAHQESTQQEKEVKKEKQKRARARIIEQFMNSWIGKPVSSYIRKVGPATQIADDGAGGRIYVWEKMSHLPRATTRLIEDWDHYFQRPEYELETVISPSISNRLMFYTRADGTIYYWRID